MNRFGVLNLLIAIGLVANVIAIDCNNRPERTEFEQCCPQGSLLPKEEVTECSEYLNTDDGPPDGGPGDHRGPGGPGGHKHFKSACYIDCVFNKTQLFKNHKIDDVKLKDYLSTVLSNNTDFVPIVQTAFSTCFAKGKEFEAMMEKNPRPSPPPNTDGRKMCRRCGAMMLHCVHIETFKNCPQSVWKNDDACNNVREFVKECKPHHGPHGKPPM